MKSLIILAAWAIGAACAVHAVTDWDDPEYRNKDGWRLCQGWLDATPDERSKMPDWCEDWATGDE